VTTRVAITRTSPTGTVFMSFAFPEETLTNNITNPDVDPITETPEFKVAAVAVERIEAPAGFSAEPALRASPGRDLPSHG
jgi:predicted molibdopterin-dependent oxidoreductase YjgC